MSTELLDDYFEVAVNLEKDLAQRVKKEDCINGQSQRATCDSIPKKGRHRLTAEVAAYFDSVFKICPHPTRVERGLIGDHCGVSLHHVTQWFTNRRFRESKGVSTVSNNRECDTHIIPSPVTSPESIDSPTFPTKGSK